MAENKNIFYTISIETGKPVSSVNELKKAVKQLEEELGKLKAAGKGAGDIEFDRLKTKVLAAKTEIQNFNNELKVAPSFTQKLANSFEQAFFKIGAGLAGVFAIDKIIDFGAASIKAFQEAELNAKKLQTAVRVNGGLGSDFEKLIKQSEELQKKTIFDDDTIQNVQTAALQFGLTADQVEKLLPVITDFASATGQDLNSALQDVLKALNGSDKGLKIYGVEVDTTKNKLEILDEVTGKLNDKFKGQADIIANTSAGAMKQLGNSADELKEKFGGLLTDIGKFFSDAALAALDFQKFIAVKAGENLQKVREKQAKEDEIYIESYQKGISNLTLESLQQLEKDKEEIRKNATGALKKDNDRQLIAIRALLTERKALQVQELSNAEELAKKKKENDEKALENSKKAKEKEIQNIKDALKQEEEIFNASKSNLKDKDRFGYESAIKGAEKYIKYLQDNKDKLVANKVLSEQEFKNQIDNAVNIIKDSTDGLKELNIDFASILFPPDSLAKIEFEIKEKVKSIQDSLSKSIRRGSTGGVPLISFDESSFIDTRKKVQELSKLFEDYYKKQEEESKRLVNNRIQDIDRELSKEKLSASEKSKLLQERALLEKELQAIALNTQIQQLEADKELGIISDENLKKLDDLIKKYKELKGEISAGGGKNKFGGADLNSDIAKGLTDLLGIEITEKDVEMVSSMAANLTAELINLSNMRAENEIANINRVRDEQLQALEDQYTLDSKYGALTIEDEKKYQATRNKIQQDARKQEDKIRREQFNKNKAYAAAQAAINGALAILRAAGELSFAGFIAMSALVAAQVAVIASAKPPAMKKGGILDGPSHEQGGIMAVNKSGKAIAEVEGGEIILTKNVAKDPKLKDIASAINVMAGGKAFARGGIIPQMQTGGVLQSSQPINIDNSFDTSNLERILDDKLTNIKAYVLEKEITKAQNINTNIERRANLS